MVLDPILTNATGKHHEVTHDGKIFKMTSLICYFSSGNGVLRNDDQLLAYPGLARSEFDRGLGQHMTGRNSAPDFVVYGPVSVHLWGQHFVAGIRFFRDVVHGVTLTLGQSRVAALGYDAAEKDLLAEKKTLTTMLSKQLECSPSSTSLGADVFDFPWGGVVSRADLKATWCGIEVHMTNRTVQASFTSLPADVRE